MDTQTLSSRRTFLKAAPAAAILAALPVVAFAGQAIAARTSLSVADAIVQHKAAMRAVRRHNRLVSRLYRTPGYPPHPRVQIGYLLRGKAADGSDIREPIYAYDHERIDQDRAMWMASSQSFGGDAYAEKYRAKFAKHHRQLTLLIRARNRFERSIGLTAALEAEKAAYDAETRASARLILARPRSAAEAEAKRRYITRNAAMRDWSEGADAARTVRDLSCEVVD